MYAPRAKSEMIRVLLVDDHELFRTGMRSILDSLDGVEVIGEAGCGEDAVEMAVKLLPHVVLMDVHMPGIGGIEATRKLLRQLPHVKVVALTALSADPFPSQLLDAGASAFLSKGCTADEVLEAINAVSQGGYYLSNDVARKLSLSRLTDGGDRSAVTKLSARELQILTMITQGQGTREISEALFLSPKTISTYRHRIYEKLDVTNDVELTHYALRHELIDPPQ